MSEVRVGGRCFGRKKQGKWRGVAEELQELEVSSSFKIRIVTQKLSDGGKGCPVSNLLRIPQAKVTGNRGLAI